MIRFIVYPRRTLFGRKWNWMLKAGNGEIIAHGEGYSRKIDCLNAVRLVADVDGKTPVDIQETG